MANVTLKNVTGKSIEGGLDLTIGDREFIVLTGPASSGSSTIVRLIAGLDRVSQGEILFDDRRIDGLASKDRDVALVARDYTPYPRLSVFENLAMGLRRRNFADKEISKRIADVTAGLGWESQLERSSGSLSREERLFVDLARAMVRQPKVYLFDEPFAGVEPAAARRARAEIVKLHQRSSATIIYATTNPAEPLAVDQRTVVLDSGVIQQDGVAHDIFSAPANLVVAKFFGDPPMNLVAGTVKQERSRLVFFEAGDGTIALPLPWDQHSDATDFLGKPVVLGFHAEDVEVDSSPGAAASGATTFRGLVERVEVTGLLTEVYLQTGAHSLIAAVGRDRGGPAAGHRLHFAIRPEKTHLFDPQTGGRVTKIV